MVNSGLISAYLVCWYAIFMKECFAKLKVNLIKIYFFLSVMHSQHKLNTSKIFMSKLNVVNLCCSLI